MRASHVSRFVLATVTAAALVATAPAAFAQTRPAAAGAGVTAAAPTPAPQPAGTAGPALSFRAFFHAGYTGFTASDTFDAVLGSPTGPVYGGGLQVVHRRGNFFQLDLSRFSDEGERVFVSDGEVVPLGIPLSVEVTPIEFSGGYRFGPKRRAVRVPPPPPPTPPRPIFKPANPRPGARTRWHGGRGGCQRDRGPAPWLSRRPATMRADPVMPSARRRQGRFDVQSPPRSR